MAGFESNLKAETSMEIAICNLCNDTDTTVLYTIPDFLLGRDDVTATLVQCNTCGLIYQNPRPPLSEIQAHYPPEYEPYIDHVENAQTNWFLRKAIEYGIAKRCRFVTRHKREGALLDVGCATGTFLRGMQTCGAWELYGVEINETAAEMARKRYDFDVFTGTLEQASFPDGSFDAVTLWDVLEHLHYPLDSLHEIHRILKPGGVVVIRVPNANSWDARIFGPYWAGLDAPRHLYVFTPTTLTQLLSHSGFDVVDHSCAIGSYMTFVLSVRFWLRAKGVSPQILDTATTVLYHPIMRLMSAPFFYVSGLTLRGPLLVTTARKV